MERNQGYHHYLLCVWFLQSISVATIGKWFSTHTYYLSQWNKISIDLISYSCTPPLYVRVLRVTRGSEAWWTFINWLFADHYDDMALVGTIMKSRQFRIRTKVLFKDLIQHTKDQLLRTLLLVEEYEISLIKILNSALLWPLEPSHTHWHRHKRRCWFLWTKDPFTLSVSINAATMLWCY